ncbi:MAG: hypothetical protein AB7R89_26675 [Dehalococcoidia bacterium]
MNEGERQLLGVVVICGMLIGAVFATWPRGTPAVVAPASIVCSSAGDPATAVERAWGLWPEDESCSERHIP